MAAAAVALPVDTLAMLSRPQIGIGRLPIRRPSSNESRQAMNCKSCRKRKIKCNRLKPSCEACQVFNCPCVYDAVPKKRGPKTDVLEALVKRVNGLEKRLKDETNPDAADDLDMDAAEEESKDGESSAIETVVLESIPAESSRIDQHRKRPPLGGAMTSLPHFQNREPIAFTDALLDTYFARIHSKPYYILDEPNTRQRLREGHLPHFLVNAIHAVSIRYVPNLCGGYSGAVRTSQSYATQARAEIDVDEPSIDHLQALLLLAMANFQAGKGKKSYMLLSHAISMAFALELHRELPRHLRVAAVEREGRRKLFWTCYLMDRFTTSGSKRPTLISDESICLRYPAWATIGSQRSVEGNYFPNGSNLPNTSSHSNIINGGAAMLVEAVRILGVTNRYLASGGVKGDSHFPWHAQSTLSRIRSDLDKWAASTQDAFSSLEGLFGQQDRVTLVLSKLVYHLVHCLLYRPFLPVDLAELSGNSQNQSWQIEATNLCFMHANAIVELVDIGKNMGIIYWPSFVGYCICTAGTIHIHGAHYVSLKDGDAFSNSNDFITREMSQLADQSLIWAGVHHQRETMQVVFASHSQLVQSLACSPIRFAPVFQMEDFFDRYQGANIDGAHMTFSEIVIDFAQERQGSFQDTTPRNNSWPNGSLEDHQSTPHPVLYSQDISGPSYTMAHSERPVKKRRMTEGSDYPYPTPTVESQPNPFEQQDRLLQDRIPSQTPNNSNSSNAHDDFHELSHQISGNEESSNPTLGHSVFSPSFALSPMTYNMVLQNGQGNGIDRLQPVTSADDGQTPSGFSASAQSSNTIEAENDPFLSFLESLAQNGASGLTSDLDLFMNERQDSTFADSMS